MEDMTSELNNIDETVFERINSSLQDIRDKPNDNAKIMNLIDQVTQMNKVLHRLFYLMSISTKNDNHLENLDKHLESLGNHLGSHDKHLESHDRYLEAHDHHIELLTKRLDIR